MWCVQFSLLHMFCIMFMRNHTTNKDMFKLAITSNKEHDWTPVKYLNVLHHSRTQNPLQHFFLNTLQKYYQLLIFRYFEHVWPLPSKTIMLACRSFDVYPYAKNQLHLYLLFWDIVKTLRTCYFENFGNAWPSHQNHSINL